MEVGAVFARFLWAVAFELDTQHLNHSGFCHAPHDRGAAIVDQIERRREEKLSCGEIPLSTEVYSPVPKIRTCMWWHWILYAKNPTR